MRKRPRRIAALIARLSPRDIAAGDWRVWARLPRRLDAQVAAIDRITGTLTVGYPRCAGKRPAARIAPCRLLTAAHLSISALRRLQALERSHRRRCVLVAYRLAPFTSISRR